ncbi:hypothetical protein phiPsa397_053 [Pseudomonas phage phiPsa397]|uniref:Uncharacterized protein n=1 Tax=Pseudomonas phage phiPsa397 TaxID=1460367 RepID=A0A7G9V3E3_9CAUD|nr:hypothetical protein QGX16_gp172 [Pseudomonas phage phiPsa397]QNO00799.1 hypothetical protein phiPsa397_053 [Pseudomonas phage phiPsa397]
MSVKKKEQLGMNPSTAANRLVKDLLWNFIKTTGKSACCKCGEPMSRETFSIEHVTPWLDSDDPVGLYFDTENIGYSHLRCNVEDRRIPRKYETKEEAYQAELVLDSARRRAKYDPEKRRQSYLAKGQ